MGFPRLEDLCLSCVSQYIIEEKLDVSNWKFLPAHSNQMYRLIKNVENESQLRGLNVKNVELTEMKVNVAHFLSTQKLETFELGGCNYNDAFIFPQFFSHAFNNSSRQNLKVLKIKENQMHDDLTRYCSTILEFFPNLEHLEFNKLQIKPGDLEKIVKMVPKLKSLDLSSGTIHGDLKALEKLEHLEGLVLKNMLNIEDNTALMKLPKLKILNFSTQENPDNDALVDLHRALLENSEDVVFPHLHTLDLTGRNVEEEILDTFVKSMPKLKRIGLFRSSLDYNDEIINKYPYIEILNFGNYESMAACLRFYSTWDSEYYSEYVFDRISEVLNALDEVEGVEVLLDEILNSLEIKKWTKESETTHLYLLFDMFNNENVPVTPEQTQRMVKFVMKYLSLSKINGYSNGIQAHFWEILSLERIQNTEGVNRIDLLLLAIDLFGKNEWRLIESIQRKVIENVMDYCFKFENALEIPLIPDRYRIILDYFQNELNVENLIENGMEHLSNGVFVYNYFVFLAKFQPFSMDSLMDLVNQSNLMHYFYGLYGFEPINYS